VTLAAIREVSPEATMARRLGLGEPGMPLGVPPKILDALGGEETGECGFHCFFLSIEFTCMQDELRGAG
jgi:hypothetical protein